MGQNRTEKLDKKHLIAPALQMVGLALTWLLGGDADAAPVDNTECTNDCHTHDPGNKDVDVEVSHKVKIDR